MFTNAFYSSAKKRARNNFYEENSAIVKLLCTRTLKLFGKQIHGQVYNFSVPFPEESRPNIQDSALSEPSAHAFL